MGLSRAQILWDMVRPKASNDGIVPTRPQVDAIDLQLRARIKDVQDDLNVAKGRILALTARIAALEAKVP